MSDEESLSGENPPPGASDQGEEKEIEYARAGSFEEPVSLLRRVQEVADIGVWEYDPAADVVKGTDQLYRLLELSEGAELDLDTGLSFCSADVRDSVEEAVRQCLQDGTPFDLEVPIVTAENNRRWARLQGELREIEGGAVRMTGILQDITEQKEIERTLREEQEVLRQMYRITAYGTASFEKKVQKLIDLGRNHLQLPYGHVTRILEDAQEIMHASGGHPRIKPGDTCPLSQTYCRKTIEQESLLAVQNAPEEGWAGDPAYESFNLDTYIGSKIRVGGDLYGTFCFAAEKPREQPFAERERTFVELLTLWASYEIERRRAKDRLEKQNQRLDRFASVVSHDLRNPLNVAQGRLQLAKEELGLDSESEDLWLGRSLTGDHLQSVGRALGRMNEIIEDMLVLTWGRREVESGDTEPVDLTKVAKRCWSHVAVEEASLSVEAVPPIAAHEGRVRQLFENLFRNAVEHGGKEVSVRVGDLPGGFYVEDDGPGIPEEMREKVLETGYSTNEEGTGLGLSIAGTVAEAHGWDLSVVEGEEGGARFEIRGVEEAEPGRPSE